MKENIVKYIFVFSVAGLIIAAVYNIVYKNSINKTIENVEKTIKSINYEDKLTIAVSNYDTINPIISTNKEVINISRLVFEPLMSMDENYKINFCIAKECAKLNDLSYLIKIDNSIKWHDGTNLTPEDVKYTINKIKESNSIYSDNVSEIEQVEIIDEDSIRIDLNNSDPFFEYKLVFPIIKKENYINYGESNHEEDLIGTGIYKISTVNNNQIILKINESYRRLNEEININEIDVILYENMEKVYEEFKIGNIDIFNTSNIYYKENIGAVNYKIKEYEGRNTDFLVLNCNKKSLNEKDVRKAIEIAVDKKNIIQKIYNGQYEAIKSPINYGAYKITNEEEYCGDRERAKQLLQNAGYVLNNRVLQRKNEYGRKNNLSLNLVVDESNQNRVKVAQLIQENLNELGIQINLIKVPNNIYLEYLQNKNYDIILTGINNGINTDYNYFFGENNISGYSNADLKDIINEISNIKDDELLRKEFNRLNIYFEDEIPYIGLYRDKGYLIISDKISGDFSPNNYFPFYNIETWKKL